MAKLTPQNKLLNRIKGTPKSAKGKRASFHATPSKDFLSQSLSIPGTPSDLNATDFDFDSVQTPALPVEMFVSPMSGKSNKKSSRRSSGVGGLMSDSDTPKADYTNVRGVKQLLKTPGAPPKSPMNDLTNVAGVKKLMATPKVAKSPKNDLTNVGGVKKLLKTPGGAPKSPANSLTDLKGVKQLMKTPGGAQKSPKNDLTNVGGVKKLMKTPGGAPKSPANSLTDLRGVKQLMKTPGGAQKSPKNDLTNVAGVSTC